MLKSAGCLGLLARWSNKLRPLFAVLLGLFVLGQVIFFLAANLLGFLPTLRDNLQDTAWARALAPDWLDKKGRADEVLIKATAVCQRWQELTGQPENWSLFAPNVSNDIWFVRVEMDWRDSDSSAPDGALQPVSCFSENEPPDPNRFFRVGRFRIRRYEMTVEAHVYKEADKLPEDRAADWRDTIREKVRKDWDNMQAYLHYRLRRFHEQRPDLPTPRQLVLIVRHYVIPPPSQAPFSWEVPEEVPIARWRLADPPSDEYLPIEAYDPVTCRFELVAR
ncbi:MAG: hypothetical protein ACJ8FY_06775 [Gemmataceae bacterium]